jgi:hypothetical protein
MKARRFSVAKAMAVTALVAIDLAWLRVTLFGIGSVGRFDQALHLANGFLFDYGLFGMFNLLALSLLGLSSCERGWRWSLIGFEVVGLLAMLAYWGCCCQWGAWFLPEPRGSRGWGLYRVGEVTCEVLRTAGVDPNAIDAQLGCNPVVHLVMMVVLTSPQFLVAVTGGWFVRLAASRGESERPEPAEALPAPAVEGPYA